MSYSTHIAIVGAGALGQAVAHVLREKKSVRCSLYDKDATKIPDQGSLHETVAGALVVFFCVPSWAVREALQEAGEFFADGTLVVVLSKGLEESSSKTMDIVCDETLPPRALWALLSGPMLARELSEGLPGCGVVASRSREALRILRKVFRGTPLSLSYSTDAHGVALSGVLKNVYSFGIGIADGIRLGNNAKGILVSRALGEMAALVSKLGGKRSTALGVAGAGDFIATCFSPYSRNRMAGERIGATGTLSLTSEGSHSLAAFENLFQQEEVKTPPFFQLILEASRGGEVQPLFEDFLAS